MPKDLHSKRLEAVETAAEMILFLGSREQVRALGLHLALGVECIARGPNRPAGASKEELLTISAFVLEAFESDELEQAGDA